MKIVDALRRLPVSASASMTIQQAASLMEAKGVGALGIAGQDDKLVGIVTDRDLVRRCLAKGLPLDARVDSVMSTPVVTVDIDADIREAYRLFRGHALRRLVVVRDGELAGMLTVDDLLVDAASRMVDLTRPITEEILAAHHDSPLPARA